MTKSRSSRSSRPKVGEVTKLLRALRRQDSHWTFLLFFSGRTFSMNLCSFRNFTCRTRARDLYGVINERNLLKISAQKGSKKAGHKWFVDLRISPLLDRGYVTAASSYYWATVYFLQKRVPGDKFLFVNQSSFLKRGTLPSIFRKSFCRVQRVAINWHFSSCINWTVP